MTTTLPLYSQWITRLKSIEESKRLRAECDRVWFRSHEIRAEGERLWEQAIRETYGGKPAWKSWNKKLNDYEYHVGGDVYGFTNEDVSKEAEIEKSKNGKEEREDDLDKELAWDIGQEEHA